jgi:hypothetical protein
MAHPWLPLHAVEAALPAIRAAGVSAVATGARRSTVTGPGFLLNYRRSGGDPRRMAQMQATAHTSWADRRAGFVARHVAQARAHGEPWWVDGQPTRRHLGLIAWAYTPTPRRFARWLRQVSR